MKIVLLGDVGVTSYHKKQIKNIDPYLLTADLVIADLAYPIIYNDKVSNNTKLNPVKCSIDTIDLLKDLNVNVVSFCTNHATDYGADGIKQTFNSLDKGGINYFGAGVNIQEAIKPHIFDAGKQKVLNIGFSWPSIGGTPATSKRPGVVPLRRDIIYKTVSNFKKYYPNYLLFVFFHWNYELEAYPQPYHRKIAHDLIDIGANLIVGNHTHRFGPVEVYNDKLIIYSLGNWVHSTFKIRNLNLDYPPISKKQKAVIINYEGKKITELILSNHHWNSNYESIHFIKRDSILKNCSVNILQDIPLDQYDRWFKKNRVRKKFLPVFLTNETPLSYFIKTTFVLFRAQFLKILVYLSIKKGLNINNYKIQE